MKTPELQAPIGLFGGTFDPIHYGHLRLAEEARELLGLERVLFIPSHRPPHRITPQASARQRYDMLQLALAQNPDFVLEPYEMQRDEKSYTLHTLEFLRQREGKQRPFVWLIGADAFERLDQWHQWQALFELTHFAIANRAGFSPAQWPASLAAHCRTRQLSDAAALGASTHGKVFSFHMTGLAISASLVREHCAHQRSTRYLVPDSVRDYFSQHLIYHHSP